MRMTVKQETKAATMRDIILRQWHAFGTPAQWFLYVNAFGDFAALNADSEQASALEIIAAHGFSL